MREFKVVKLYNGITNVVDGYVEEAQNLRLKKRMPPWLKWGMAACLCLAAGLGALALADRKGAWGGGNGSSNGFWGNGDHALLQAHRDAFTQGLSGGAQVAFGEAPGVSGEAQGGSGGTSDMPKVMKIYRTLNNEWFLAEDMTDFSQALEEKEFYIVYESGEGAGSPAQTDAYTIYTLDEGGQPRWGGKVSTEEKYSVPYGLFWLTEDIIEKDLEGVDYEDYIIAQSTRLYTVFIWARCADGEDVFVTYPARPEFVGLENRGRYTLEELRHILTEAYRAP